MPTRASTGARKAKGAGRAAEPAVILTGVCGRLGRLLLRQLHREGRVVGIDRRDFVDGPPDLAHNRLDIRRKAVATCSAASRSARSCTWA